MPALPTSQNFVMVKFAESHHGHKKKTQDVVKSWFALIICVTLGKSFNFAEVQVKKEETQSGSSSCRRALILPLQYTSPPVYKSEDHLMGKTNILENLEHSLNWEVGDRWAEAFEHPEQLVLWERGLMMLWGRPVLSPSPKCWHLFWPGWTYFYPSTSRAY